jgi:hypothetical protein
MSDWLDTQTRVILEGVDSPRVAPSLDADFSLVLLDRGRHLEHVERALSRIFEPEYYEKIPHLLAKTCPLIIESSISYEEASLGQFELICADSISVILRDDVALDGDYAYLENLYRSLRMSREFEHVTVTILSLPMDRRAQSFSDQFSGCENLVLPLALPTTRKKARIMQHWAGKIGARMGILLET